VEWHFTPARGPVVRASAD